MTLASSDARELLAPAQVIIPAGQTSAAFHMTIVDDTRIDGLQSITLTAQVANWTTGSAAIDIADNETTTLVLNIPATLREGDLAADATVRISGTLPADLTVNLASSDTSELVVPASIAIAAGQTSATFAATVVNDTLMDGAQPVTLSAAANGFTFASVSLTVADNEIHHFTVGAVASPQTQNQTFPLTVTAKDVNDAVITNFTAPVTLRAAGSAGVIAVNPAVLNGWAGGVWSGNVAVATEGTAIVLSADDGQGHTGNSNPFDAVTGPGFDSNN